MKRCVQIRKDTYSMYQGTFGFIQDSFTYRGICGYLVSVINDYGETETLHFFLGELELSPHYNWGF